MKPLAKRFWAKVKRGKDSECWLWTGCITGANRRDSRNGGYGNIGVRIGQKWTMVGAHIVSYQLNVGPVPNGMTIDHVCRNRACVNPAHLDPVPFAVNILRGNGFSGRNARKTVCNRGHTLSGDNLRMEGKSRRCRECARIASVKFRTKSNT